MSAKIHATRGGYNENLFVGKSKEELTEIKCGICLEAWRDPRQCSNGHVYCESCTCARDDEIDICPECREDVDNWIPNLVAKKNVEKMTVKCLSQLNPGKSEMRTCKWQGPLHSLKKHVEVDCLLTRVRCDHKGCEAKVKRADLSLHRSVCKFRLERCVHCNRKVSVICKQAHEGKCEFRHVDCDLKCGERIMLKDLKAHKTDHCSNFHMPCPMYQLAQTCSGCKGEVKRCEMESHLTNPAVLPSNFMTLLTAVLEMKNGSASTKKKGKL